jgi:hypothetical protein
MSKRVLGYSIIVVGLILVVTLVGAFSVGAVFAQGECSLSTLQGTYLFEARGVHLEEDGAVLPYAEAGVWTMDGAGNGAGFISASIDGVPFARRDAFTATYEHSSDCVYAVVDEFGLEVDLYT